MSVRRDQQNMVSDANITDSEDGRPSERVNNAGQTPVRNRNNGIDGVSDVPTANNMDGYEKTSFQITK